MAPANSSHRATTRRTTVGTDAPVLDLLARLTDRDLLILEHLADHQILTAPIVADLAFGSVRHAQERLKTLTDLRAVTRFRRRLVVGSEHYRYVLAHTGAVIVAHRRGQEPPTPRAVRGSADRLAASPRLGHTLGLNTFCAALAGHARRTVGCELTEWWPESRCAEVFGAFARPDAYLRWAEAGQRLEFFLEYDTGTERPATRLSDKLPGYSDLSTALQRPIHLLFWLPGPSREATARTALDHAPAPGVRVATANPAHGHPAGTAWLPLGATGRRRLTDLPFTT